jgi:hypothetical protein
LDHVTRVLNEIKGLMEEVGRRVQRERGVEDPTGDFGLELVAGFKRGSVEANLEITRNEAIGAIVAQQIMQTVTRLGQPRKARTGKLAAGDGDFDPRMVTRLGNIAKVQEIDKTKIVLSLRTGRAKAKTAVLDTRAVKAVTALREPNFSVEGLTVYGKLRELRDKYDDDEESKRAFFGELLADDGTVWRVEFKAREVDRAASLFRKQVYVTGQAVYYKAMSPKLIAAEFGADEERDYEAMFDELFGSNPELAGADLSVLLKELRNDA